MALMEASKLHVDGRVADVSMTVQPGELLGIIGPNGAGKSSLLHGLAGILPTEGDVRFEGRQVGELTARQRAQRIGLLPQTIESAWSLRVEDVVALGRLPWNDSDADAITQAMRLAGVAELAGRKVDELSGGERARVWLARVLAGRPQLLLADEPIASLDMQHQLSVMEVLRDYARQGHAVIMSIHDLSLAARYCDRLCLLDHGRLHTQGLPAEVLTGEVLSEVFGVAVHVDLQATPPVILPLRV